VSWYAHHLPDWVLSFCTGSALVIELIIPFLMFLPRGPRFFAAWATILMQVLILLTSNHNFVNLLTIFLCLFLFDDRAVSRVVPSAARHWLTRRQAAALTGKPVQAVLIGLLGVLLVVVSSAQAWVMITHKTLPEPLDTVVERLRPFRLTSNYHVFPTMKTQRIEIIVEGSADGKTWRSYEFKYKPGDAGRRPEVVVPHQPRLDWLMWFVPIAPPFLPILEGLGQRLLENSSPVIDLLDSNPFPDEPPRYLRFSQYRYHFTSPETRRATGQWWEREYLGPFFPLPWMERRSATPAEPAAEP
jgi:hypothetical protein